MKKIILIQYKHDNGNINNQGFVINKKEFNNWFIKENKKRKKAKELVYFKDEFVLTNIYKL